jgi:hypothetical protein
MIRTIWLAAACLVVLGAMAAGKVAKTPSQTTAGTAVDEAITGFSSARDPLIKADRLEVTYVRPELSNKPPLQPTDPIIPETQRMISPVEPNIVSRHWHDPNAPNSSAAKSSELRRRVDLRGITKTARLRIFPSSASRLSVVIAPAHLVAS